MPPRLRQTPITPTSLLKHLPSHAPHPPLFLFAQSRCLSAATPRAGRATRKPQGPSQRSLFFNWINGPGAVFKQAEEDGPKYITSYDKYTGERKETADGYSIIPFPQNKLFKSQPVLSNEMREEIYQRVQTQGKGIRQVSAELAVSLERVAAVVRLKAVEKEWVDSGKHISTYLTSALERMLPITHLTWHQEQKIHENIQDLTSHPLAARQAFVPASESREFTRADAGKEFGLPAADEAVPHPELVVLKREKMEMLSDAERAERLAERDRIAQGQRKEKELRAKKKEEGERIVEQGRWKWKLQEARAGQVGFRYGYPLPDRKKGHVKIPTRVA